FLFTFFFASRRRHTSSKRDWSSDVCSSDLSSPHRDIKQFPCHPMVNCPTLQLKTFLDRLGGYGSDKPNHHQKFHDLQFQSPGRRTDLVVLLAQLSGYCLYYLVPLERSHQFFHNW